MARAEQCAVGTVRAEITFAEKLQRDLPLTAAALRAGEVSLDKAKVIARVCPTSDLRRTALKDAEAGEAFLLAQAAEMDVRDLIRLAQAWAYAVDPDKGDADYRDQAGDHHFDLNDTLDGTDVRGFLSHDSGEALRTALKAIIGIPPKGDRKTPGQRQAEAIYTLSRFLLDSGELGEHAKIRPHLNVTVSYETLIAVATRTRHETTCTQTGLLDLSLDGARPGSPRLGPAFLTDTGQPIPKVVLERMCCDSEMSRTIFGAESVILDSGRSRRIVSPDQRRSVIARDKSCRRPGCSLPARYCEVHHRIWWERGGGTNVHDSVLLCFGCHDWVHREDIAITRRGNHWIFTDPGGREIH